MDRRAEDHGSKPNNRRPFQRLRSPSRYTRLYRPRFEAKHFRSRFRFFRTMEERNFHRPNFAQRYQRYHRGHWSSLQLSRKPRSTSPSRQRLNKGLDKSSFKAIRQQTTDIPCPSSGERPSLPLTVSQKSNKRDAAARNRAIQKKQEQIEEVYRQDCDTFGMVVKMLVTKDPSLEESIQLSLRENLRDIGLRCIQAMEHFIQEYDSQKMDNTSNTQLHSSQ